MEQTPPSAETENHKHWNQRLFASVASVTLLAALIGGMDYLFANDQYNRLVKSAEHTPLGEAAQATLEKLQKHLPRAASFTQAATALLGAGAIAGLIYDAQERQKHSPTSAFAQREEQRKHASYNTPFHPI